MEDEALVEDVYDFDENDGNSYKEEMSRNAVGRGLFGDDGDNSFGSSPFVTGYDRTPAPPEVREVRPEKPAPRPRQETQDWRSTPKSTPSPDFHERMETAPKPRPRPPRREEESVWDDPPPQERERRREEPRAPRSEHPPIREHRSEPMPMREPMREREPQPRREEHYDERPKPRRESVTARLIHGDEDAFEMGARDGRVMRERTDRDRRRAAAANNPAPRPAARVNVAAERPMREEHPQERPREERRKNPHQQRPPGEERRRNPRREERAAMSASTTDEDLNGFRQRFNPGELVSSPRNTNRPVRAGQARDVRKNRAKSEPAVREAESVSPIRWILAAGALAVLVLIVFLVIRMNSFASYRDEVYDARLAAETAETNLSAVNTLLSDLQRRYNNLRTEFDELREVNPTPGNPGDPGNPHELAVILPTYHVVVGGDILHAIALRYFPNVEPIELAMDHIFRSNQHIRAFTDPNMLHAGWRLRIEPMYSPTPPPAEGNGNGDGYIDE
jgi:hypothetical protein